MTELRARNRDSAIESERSPEAELLLNCARSTLGHRTSKRTVELLRGNLDWALFECLGVRNGVAPLLFQSLNALGSDGVPAPVMERLGEHARRSTQRNLMLT